MHNTVLYEVAVVQYIAVSLCCSAGVGRTGAFILLDTALGQASGERRMDLPDILTRLRNQRMKLVQTPVGLL